MLYFYARAVRVIVWQLELLDEAGVSERKRKTNTPGVSTA
jgi:hypothetical protein